MNRDQEKLYRKWLGICQQSALSPLTMNLAGGVVIKVKGEVLLELTHDEYEELTADQIVDKLGARKYE